MCTQVKCLVPFIYVLFLWILLIWILFHPVIFSHAVLNILQSVTSPHSSILFDLLMTSTTYYKNQYFNKNVNMK